MAKIFIGTSGFSYPHWREVFYPENLPQKDWFLYYAKQFDTVEINASFYQFPKKEVFAGWRRKANLTNAKFVFAVKGWRWITHIKKLKNCEQELGKFFGELEGLKTPNQILNLKSKDVILWQLPPSMNRDDNRLSSFLKNLPGEWRHAFEFRNSTWIAPEIFNLLQEFNAAVVFQDFSEWPITERITADFVYLRFHGRTSLYSSCYTKKELRWWAEKIKNWANKGLDVYAYFNNDALGYAVENAKELKKFLISNYSN